MEQSYIQDKRASTPDTGPNAISRLVRQLPGVSQLYRTLKDWQAEFKPRRYDGHYASIPIEGREK